MDGRRKTQVGAGLLGALAAFVVLLFGYSNCSNVRLSKAQTLSSSEAKASGSFCSDPGTDGNQVLNFVFIVDMSGSNAGYPQYGITGTDPIPNMERLKLIEAFLSQDCAHRNPKNKFAVIGFSNNAIVGANATTAVCDAGVLQDSSGAVGQINDLRKIQTDDTPRNPRQTMLYTQYNRGFSCAQSIIQGHINSLPSQDRGSSAYMVYFLTDGAPTDIGLYNPAVETIANYINRYNAYITPTVQRLMTTGRSAGGIRVAPISYGDSAMSSDEQQIAHGILDFIGRLGNSLRVSVNDVKTVDFCKILESGSREKYTVKKFGVVNMTALMRNGKLLADSDADGISDSEEVDLGFDPLKPRSEVGGNQLLDGVCAIKGQNASQCTPQNNCGFPNKLGLTKCDVAALGLADGVDSDRDYIPDLVEIVKGTNPILDDRDFEDGDQLPLSEELDQGRDPFHPDNDLPPQLRVAFSYKMSATAVQGCAPTQESWNFALNNIPLAETLAVQPTDAISASVPYIYNHYKNENVIFIYYIVGKQNNDPANPTPEILFGQFVRVNYKLPTINFSNFEKMGTIDGLFKPIQ